MEGEEHCAMRNWTQTSVTLVYNEKVKTNIEWECGEWTVEAVCGQHGSDSISIYNGSGASTAYSHNTYTSTIHVLLCHWSFCPRNVSMNNEFTYCKIVTVNGCADGHSLFILFPLFLYLVSFLMCFLSLSFSFALKWINSNTICVYVERENGWSFSALIKMLWLWCDNWCFFFSLFLSNLCRWWIECVWMTQNAIYRVVESTSFYPLVTSRMVYEIIKWIKELIHTPTHRRQPANGTKANERMQKKQREELE